MPLEGNFSQSKQLSLKLVSIFTEFSFGLRFSYLGVVVDLHTRLRVDVLGANNLTVPLQRLQLKELCCGQELRGKKKKKIHMVHLLNYGTLRVSDRKTIGGIAARRRL